MGAEDFFITIYSDDRKVVEKKWKQLCKEESDWQRKQTLKTIKEEYPKEEQQEALNNFEKIHKEYVAYNESLFSFDNYKYEWHTPVFDVGPRFTTPADIREYILKKHEKWSPAIAISWRGLTVIGGYVAS